MKEKWLPVVGFESCYEVSDYGRVRDLVLRKQVKVSCSPSTYGYPTCYLRGKGKRGQYRVHKLVLEAFRGPRPLRKECAHWDRDRSNNVLSNLRWATHAENHHDAIHQGVNGKKLTLAQVGEIRGAYPRVSKQELAARYGVVVSTVYAIVSGAIWRP